MFIEEVQKFDKLQTSKTVKLQLQFKMIMMWYSCLSHVQHVPSKVTTIECLGSTVLQTSLDQKVYIMFLLSNVQYNCIRCYMMMLPVPSNAPRRFFLLSHADIHSHIYKKWNNWIFIYCNWCWAKFVDVNIQNLWLETNAWGYLENFIKKVWLKRLDPMELSWKFHKGSIC